MASTTPRGIAISKISIAWKTLSALAVILAVALLGWTTSVSHGPRESRTIALTLDDGPNPPYTEKFLQLLTRERIPATFFFIGRNIELHRASALAVVQSGHEIGNHTYSHRRLSYTAPWTARDEITKTDKLIRALGYSGAIPFRAPFGEKWGLHAPLLLVAGRTNVLYDVEPDPPDYFRASPAKIAESSLARTLDGSILLLHDGEGIRIESLEAAARLIPELKKKGFSFVKVSELLGKEGLLSDGE